MAPNLYRCHTARGVYTVTAATPADARSAVHDLPGLRWVPVYLTTWAGKAPSPTR